MKKILLQISLVIFTFSPAMLKAQCLSDDYGQYPEEIFIPDCTGIQAEISDTCYTAEYSMVEVIEGTTYVFTSNEASDFITISDEDGENVLAFGPSNVSWTAPTNALIRFYVHLDDACEGSNDTRTRSITCTSALSAPDFNTTSFDFYPNPVTHVLDYQSNEKITYLVLYNVLGQKITEQVVNNQTGKLDCSMVTPGHYILKVKTADSLKTVKLIKD